MGWHGRAWLRTRVFGWSKKKKKKGVGVFSHPRKHGGSFLQGEAGPVYRGRGSSLHHPLETGQLTRACAHTELTTRSRSLSPLPPT